MHQDGTHLESEWVTEMLTIWHTFETYSKNFGDHSKLQLGQALIIIKYVEIHFGTIFY